MEPSLLATFPVSTGSRAVAARVNGFEHELLTYGRNAAQVFEAVVLDPACALARAYVAFIHVLRQTREGLALATPLLEGIAACPADRREARLVRAIGCWAAEDLAGVERALAAQVDEVPEDLFAAKLLQLAHFARGDAFAMLGVIEAVLPAHGDNPAAHAMHAFALDQTGQVANAERAARRALDLGPEPWAHHALAHVFERSGRHAEGRAWMRARSGDWAHCSSFLYTHNWWHAALFDVALGDHEAAIACFHEHVWSMRRDYCQDQINAISLLARLELADADVAWLWDEIAFHVAPRSADGIDGFLDLHYAYALARAGRDGALDTMLRRAADCAGSDPASWRRLMPSALGGVVAFARGAHADAARLLAPVERSLGLLGGSTVQRDLFSRMLAAARCEVDLAA